MAYVDSSGQRHVSLSEASHGYAAQTTASRDAAGAIVGDSTGSRYSRQQEAEKTQQSTQQTQQAGFLSPSLNIQFQQEKTAIAAEQIQRQQQTQQQDQGLWERTISTFKAGYAEGRSGNLSLSDLKERSGPGWGVEGAIAGKVVSAGVSIIGEDRFKAYNAGYDIGRGRSADISSLQAPNQGKDRMISAPLYETTDNITGALSAYRNVLVRPIPGGIRPIVTGVTDFPIAFIDYAGKTPMGVETIVRNPTSSMDSIGLGLGIMAGGIVTTGEKEPGRLVGQAIGGIAGGYVLGKGAGAAGRGLKTAYSNVKPGLTKQGLSKFAKSEEGTFNLGGTKAGRKALEEWDKIDSAKAAKLETEPAYEFVEDSFGNIIAREVFTEKIKTTPTASKMPEPKLSKWEAGQKKGRDVINRGSSQGGGDNIIQSSNGMKSIMKTELKQEPKITPKITEDIKTIDLTEMKTPGEISASKINQFKSEQKRLDSIDRLHAHLEQSTFVRNPVDITPFTPKIKSLKTLNHGSKMTQAQKNAYARKQKEEILETSIAAQKEEILEIPKAAQKEKVTQDVLSIPKLTETQKYSEKQIADILEIPKAAQKEKVTQDIFSIPKMTQKEKESQVFIPLFSSHLPFAAQDFSIQVPQKQRNREIILPVIPSITQSFQIPDLTIYDPISKNSRNKDPRIPDPIPDPWSSDPWSSDPITPDPITPDPITPDPITPDPITPDPIIIPPPHTSIIIPMGGKDWDFSKALDDTPQKRRKTKKKMLKNQYGDPFKIKLNL